MTILVNKHQSEIASNIFLFKLKILEIQSINQSIDQCEADLALVRPRAAVQVQEAVAVGAQVPALRAQDDGQRLPVVVVVARRLKNKATIRINACRTENETAMQA